MSQSKVKFNIVLNAIFFALNAMFVAIGTANVITFIALAIHTGLLFYFVGKLDNASED